MLSAVTTLDRLIESTRSPSPSVRAAAGRDLAEHLGDALVDEALIALINDRDDTLPTTETTLALLQRGDDAGVRLLALALADADEDTVNHAHLVLFDVTQTESDLDDLRARVTRVAGDPDPAVRPGAAGLLAWIARA